LAFVQLVFRNPRAPCTPISVGAQDAPQCRPQQSATPAMKHWTARREQIASINPVMNAVQVAYRDSLCAFIDRWIYAHTSNSDFTLSLLNRHYLVHGVDAVLPPARFSPTIAVVLPPYRPSRAR
jgi:hypothetical protein